METLELAEVAQATNRTDEAHHYDLVGQFLHKEGEPSK
jgi:hypothetical protein